MNPGTRDDELHMCIRRRQCRLILEVLLELELLAFFKTVPLEHIHYIQLP